jgi:hypothetical protein
MASEAEVLQTGRINLLGLAICEIGRWVRIENVNA